MADPRDSTGDAVVGGGLAIGLAILALVLVINLPYPPNPILPAAVFAVGLTQALWIIPIGIWAHLHGRRSFVHGLVIGASVVLLLNAACFGLVFAALG